MAMSANECSKKNSHIRIGSGCSRTKCHEGIGFKCDSLDGLDFMKKYSHNRMEYKKKSEELCMQFDLNFLECQLWELDSLLEREIKNHKKLKYIANIDGQKDLIEINEFLSLNENPQRERHIIGKMKEIFSLKYKEIIEKTANDPESFVKISVFLCQCLPRVNRWVLTVFMYIYETQSSKFYKHITEYIHEEFLSFFFKNIREWIEKRKIGFLDDIICSMLSMISKTIEYDVFVKHLCHTSLNGKKKVVSAKNFTLILNSLNDFSIYYVSLDNEEYFEYLLEYIIDNEYVGLFKVIFEMKYETKYEWCEEETNMYLGKSSIIEFYLERRNNPLLHTNINQYLFEYIQKSITSTRTKSDLNRKKKHVSKIDILSIIHEESRHLCKKTEKKFILKKKEYFKSISGNILEDLQNYGHDSVKNSHQSKRILSSIVRMLFWTMENEMLTYEPKHIFNFLSPFYENNTFCMCIIGCFFIRVIHRLNPYFSLVEICFSQVLFPQYGFNLEDIPDKGCKKSKEEIKEIMEFYFSKEMRKKYLSSEIDTFNCDEFIEFCCTNYKYIQL